MKGLNPKPKKGGTFYIPAMRKANGESIKEVNAKSKVSRLDTWGCHLQPGKYYGRMLSGDSSFHLYGEWRGDAIAVHRDEDRDAQPVARMYLTPMGGWWLQPCVLKHEAYGLDRLKENFIEFVQTHEDLKDL